MTHAPNRLRKHPLCLAISGAIAALAVAQPSGAAGLFGTGQPITTSLNNAQAVRAADLDGDGDLDALSASETDDTIAWYENTDGQGSFGPKQAITTTADGAFSVFASDVDGDGDLDVLSASVFDDTIAWYENTDGQGSFGPEQVITATTDGPEFVVAADLDGDGDEDVLVAATFANTVAWYENTDGQGTFGPAQNLTTTAAGAQSVFAADVDGDGDLDVLSASQLDDTIAWYENTDGQGSFGSAQTLSTTANGAFSVVAGDVDADGDLDVLAASLQDDTVAWYENADGQGSFGPAQTLSTTADGARSVFVEDVDGDGDLDALSASMFDGTISWYENTDGQGSFGPAQPISTTASGTSAVLAADVDRDGDLDTLSAYSNTIAWYENETIHGQGQWSRAGAMEQVATGVESLFAADVDGDGDLDTVLASFADDRIAWLENTDGRGSFGPRQVISTSADGASSIFAADVDRDGDLDVLSASQLDATIAWYENTDGTGSFGPEHVITATAAGARSVFAADVDGDGDLDTLSASQDDDTIAWYENTNGEGSFGPRQVIGSGADGAASVFAVDVDSDGDLDALAASFDDDSIAWYQNTDGQGSFGTEQLITTTADGARSVFAADVDGDGDIDVLAASWNDDTIAWYENTDGLGAFGPEQAITTSADGARSVSASDLDGDGDLDTLAASEIDDTLAWYENTDGQGGFGPEQVVTITSDGARSVSAADVDGDGDRDLLAASYGAPTTWYENTDGRGSFSPGPIATTVDGAESVFAADLDGDGDLDVLSASQSDWTIAWYENTDGRGGFGPKQVITSTAFVALSVFAADLDGDGDFDVLSASYSNDTIAWYENTDGQGSFGPRQVITTAANGPTSVSAWDVDGDGDTDVLSASWDDDTIAWYQNTDGQGSFGAKQVISATADGAKSVSAADVDGDGDLDVLSASQNDNTIAWYKNTDGQGSFGAKQVISSAASSAFAALAADLDRDGDLDVLSAYSTGIRWYKNVNGQGSFTPAPLITTPGTDVSAADVDRDGDLDVLSSASSRIAWHENTDGGASFGPAQPIAANALAPSIFAGDVDGDGDPDVLSAEYLDDTIAWYENRSGQAEITTTSSAPAFAFQGAQVELFRFDVEHLGWTGDMDAELGTFGLSFERAPEVPLTSAAAVPLSSAEANALVENLYVYRDDGSGTLETGTDDLVATVATLNLTSGLQTIALTNGNPDVQIAPTQTVRFFVSAQLSATAGSADPKAFRIRHPSNRSEIQHTATSIVLRQAPGSGTQPRVTKLFDPAGDDDSDGVSNSAELTTYGTNPALGDTDYDGLSDGAEVNTHGTNPLSADPDSDGLLDSAEIAAGTGPFDPDSDDDGLLDGAEIAAGTNPLDSDSDDDGLGDGAEVNVHHTDPLADADYDADTISDAEEVTRGMHPLFADTDRDGYLDAADNCPSAYNPDQLDQGGFGTPDPDGIGDLCQNADFNRDGEVDILDVTLERRGLVGLEPTLDPAMPPSTP